MGIILDEGLYGQSAGVQDVATAAGSLAPPIEFGPGESFVNEAYVNPAAQRERRERDLVRFVLGHSRAELEMACLAIGQPIEGCSDEALREMLFRHHRGAPSASRLPA